MSDTTSLGFPIWDPTGSDSNENVYALLLSLIGTQAGSAMRLSETYIQDLKNTKLTIYSKAAADWASDSITVIKSGEFGIETDTGKIKLGNGVDIWSNLTYFSSVEEGDDLTVGFTEASSRTNISAGEKLSVMFGKIAKWFTDLKSVAWSGAYSDLSGTPSLGTLSEKSTVSTDDISNSAVTNAKLANMAAKTVKGNLGTASAAPSDVTMLDVAEYALDAGTVATTVADAEYVPISVSAASSKKITWANIKATLKTYFDTLYPAKSELSAKQDMIAAVGILKGTESGVVAATLGVDCAKAPVTQVITLPATDWTTSDTGAVQTINVTGMRAASITIVSPSPLDSLAEYADCQIYCSVQGFEALTFSAKSVPENDLNVNVLIVG